MIYLHFLCAADLDLARKTNRLNSIIGSSVVQDDKISLRLPSTGRQQIYPRRVATGGRNLPARAWAPMPATDGNTRHKELASCEGGAGKEMGSDEDKDLPFGSAHTQTNTDITGEEREREPLFKITTLSQPAPPH